MWRLLSSYSAWLSCPAVACGILVPPPGIEPESLALEGRFLTWTTTEVPSPLFALHSSASSFSVGSPSLLVREGSLPQSSFPSFLPCDPDNKTLPTSLCDQTNQKRRKLVGPAPTPPQATWRQTTGVQGHGYKMLSPGRALCSGWWSPLQVGADCSVHPPGPLGRAGAGHWPSGPGMG